MRRTLAVLVTAAMLALSACAADASGPRPSSSTTSASTATLQPSAPPTPAPSPTRSAVDPLAQLSLEQRVAQLFIVGTAAEWVDPTTRSALADTQAGGAFLHGRSYAGVGATAALVADLISGAGGDPWVAADQEGGYVQALAGDGFDPIPSAVEQATLDASALRTDAARWGAQLRQAGVTMNLAPVADIVTSPDDAWRNAPIGAIDREYGYDAPTVAALAGAFADGMRDAGVVPVFKHFPGLGRTEENTDVSSRVTDTTVGADSPDVSVYRDLLSGGPAAVMMSLAVYDLIDPNLPAAFSPAVIDVLREQIGFDGVVMTDDLSAAAQVSPWSAADRGVLAIDAGVDVLLVSADPSVFPEMYAAVLARAQSDPAFAEKVDAAARRVLTLKADPAFTP